MKAELSQSLRCSVASVNYKQAAKAMMSLAHRELLKSTQLNVLLTAYGKLPLVLLIEP